MTDIKKRGRKTSGPVPERVQIKGGWRNAMKKALKKERPKKGWPKPETKN